MSKSKDDSPTRSRSRERLPEQDDETMEDKFQKMFEEVVAPQLQRHGQALEATIKEGVKGLVVGELKAMETRVDSKIAIVPKDVTEVKGTLSRIEDLLAAKMAPVDNGSRSSNVYSSGPIPSPFPSPPSQASFPQASQGPLSPESLNISSFWKPPFRKHNGWCQSPIGKMESLYCRACTGSQY